MHTRKQQLEAFQRLLDIIDELREKCPWDHKQTFDSLRTNTIEETYELSDAIINHDMHNICKELGDVLMHIAFYSKMASETGDFDIKDVCDAICDKLVYRHPHVFGDIKAEDTDQVLKNWESLKLKEKDGNKTVLGGVPDSLPSLIKAYRIQDKARNVGFDWDKVAEENAEVREAITRGDQDDIEAEFGDLLFSIINAARLYGVNPDNALERTNKKFIKRFNYLETESKKDGKTLGDMTLGEMDQYWDRAKTEA